MSRLREIRSKALGVVHRGLAVPAIYLTHADGTAQLVNVRVRNVTLAAEGDFSVPAQSAFFSRDPSIVFDAAEVPNPAYQAYVFVGPSEVYLLGAATPPLHGYIVVMAEWASAAAIAAVTAKFEAGGYGPEWEGIFP